MRPVSQYAAAEYAAKHGLVTPADHIRHCHKLALSFGKAWPRERMIEHWRKVLAAPRCQIAGEFAAQALEYLHAEREPGADDEQEAA